LKVIQSTTILQAYLTAGMVAAVSLTAPTGKRLLLLALLITTVLLSLWFRRVFLKVRTVGSFRIDRFCNRSNFAAGCLVCALCIAALIAGESSDDFAKLRLAAAVALSTMATTLTAGYLLARRDRRKSAGSQ